jgi:D-tyrosyl-tRNA(Tyr) deacylase
MRAVVQRVCRAHVAVDNEIVGEIKQGLLVYLGVAQGDTAEDVKYISDKLANLRIFPDGAEKMNRSVLDIKGEILLISNFTLCGDCRKGRRPSFDQAGDPTTANELYQTVVQSLQDQGICTATGQFKAHMHVSSCNNGPVTIILDSTRVV